MSTIWSQIVNITSRLRSPSLHLSCQWVSSHQLASTINSESEYHRSDSSQGRTNFVHQTFRPPNLIFLELWSFFKSFLCLMSQLLMHAMTWQLFLSDFGSHRSLMLPLFMNGWSIFYFSSVHFSQPTCDHCWVPLARNRYISIQVRKPHTRPV